MIYYLYVLRDWHPLLQKENSCIIILEELLFTQEDWIEIHCVRN